MRTTDASMSKLSSELIADILSRLPVKSLVRFQCVSKSWNAIINCPYFIREHLERSIQKNTERAIIVKERRFLGTQEYYSVRFNEDGQFDRPVKIPQPLRDLTHIVGYCNGLVCIQKGGGLAFIPNGKEEIVIWNPWIRKYKKLPIEPIQSPYGFSEYRMPQLALGHDPVNDDYKVLRVVQFHKGYSYPSAFEVKAYSLRAHSWRRVEDEWPYKESLISTNSGAASFNGALHWLVIPVTDEEPLSQTLVAFNLATEKFRVYTLPVQTRTCLVLEVLAGRIVLCVCQNLSKSEPFSFDWGFNDFWVMKEYGVESSWTRLYTIVGFQMPWGFSYCKPLLISEDGNEVLVEQDFRNLIWYDIRKKSGRRLTRFGRCPVRLRR
ncbi:hypothetical protein SLA2020_450700 [Shorea laevis]